ncbi:transcription antitermination factor NusB [Candidatus Shikimatogenerans silvanidophilus]|uniref:transcription antitermination factor NusB n=1 Tax=Candidatus Shikimatogenerans silvanidophilus TaxID=2782547 RepID=UPI002A4E2E2F|nr:transcription antitermination factor NusB [Candidatus Shikimatogenerans silvanidophilus]
MNNDLKWFLYLKKYNYFNEYFFLFKKILKEKKFFFNLYKKTKINEKYFDKIIKNYSNNWNLNRISIIDKIILRMSLCELFYFYEIPKKVTINEYIEISKIFSTDKSKNFINGILDKVCKIKNINKN